jgi:hypothetical protein
METREKNMVWPNQSHPANLHLSLIFWDNTIYLGVFFYNSASGSYFGFGSDPEFPSAVASLI